VIHSGIHVIQIHSLKFDSSALRGVGGWDIFIFGW
jgi:hypothetical protein